nr:ricin-type beta-trefoil lectin domain protein [Dactylosporangium aurantiacum]
MSRRRIGLAITATVLVVAGTGVIAMTSASAATTGQITGYGGKCVDVAAAGTANGTQVQLYTCNGTAAQQWTVGDDGTIRALGKCLDVNAASTANGTKIQIWDCNGTSAQQWSKQSDGTLRSLGKCLDATGPSSADGTKLQLWDCFASANQQWTLPGGTTNPPTSTPPNNPNNPDLGPNVSVFDPSMSQQNFWRSAENLSVTPTGGLDRWAVSQAAPYRRMHVRGNLALSDGGWSSGGWISDSKIDGQIQSGSQQQWITRNSQIGSWSGSNWNQVFVGVQGAPANSFPSPPYTTVGTTPVVREKPFLYVDSAGAYQVFVPSLRSNSSGNSWSTGTTAGSSLPISQFYIVKAGATAASITAMTVADVDGVKVAGILFDAGTTNSQVLMEVGPSGSAADHSANPTSLHDVFFRIGGSIAGKATVSLRVNSNHVIGDHMWIWRADHGNGGTVGWNTNTAANGLSYCYFSTNPSVVLGHSFEVPVTTNVKFHNMVTVSLGGTGTIAHVINDTGAAVNSGHQVTNLVSGP